MYSLTYQKLVGLQKSLSSLDSKAAEWWSKGYTSLHFSIASIMEMRRKGEGNLIICKERVFWNSRWISYMNVAPSTKPTTAASCRQRSKLSHPWAVAPPRQHQGPQSRCNEAETDNNALGNTWASTLQPRFITMQGTQEALGGKRFKIIKWKHSCITG